MTFDESAIALLDSPHQFAVITNVEPDGSPPSNVGWLERDGDMLFISTVQGRRKRRNMV